MADYNTPRRDKRPQQISGIIGRLIGSLGLSKQYNGWMVVTNWKRIVGNKLSQSTRATHFSDGTLVVEVADASMRHNLSLQVNYLLKEIHRFPYGTAIKNIRFTRGTKGKLD